MLVRFRLVQLGRLKFVVRLLSKPNYAPKPSSNSSWELVLFAK